jgi:predicted DNA-binding transcriptional regulator AlpA
VFTFHRRNCSVFERRRHDALPDDWWTTHNAATFLGVSTSTIGTYLARKQMPPPDRRMGGMTLWRLGTIREWQNDRRPTDRQR